jgi:hypothetical protein
MPAIAVKPPLIAVLKNEQLEVVQEVEIPRGIVIPDHDRFPDMIELENVQEVLGFKTRMPDRQFFRIGITDRRAVYREGVSYRISQ